jgi:Ca-activated chloride channel homolog
MEKLKTNQVKKESKKATFLFSRCIILFLLLQAILSDMTGQVLPLGDDHTLSPYFFIRSDDPETDRLPLKSTKAKVNIAGVISDVTITQVYKNEGKKPIEAVYVFPASTRAAVYSMEMEIGERVIIAKIEERQRARQEYEQARENGQNASLLEQERPNVFTMSVANIMPGDMVKVELRYTELMIPTDRVYEFIYPAVVGPRYSSSNDDLAFSGEKWNANPYTLEGVNPLYEFNIQINLTAGLPVKDILCPSHRININYISPSKASVSLPEDEKNGGNRDFIMKYRLAGNSIETGVLLYQGDKENFFLAMIQPPDHILPEMIPPREYVFIMDVSGSMYGYPLDISKKLVTDLLGGLKPGDLFNIILFAGGSEIFSQKSVPAVTSNIQSAASFIEKERGSGGTELLPALIRALSLEESEGYSRTFIIATDGFVTIEKEAFNLVKKSLGSANFFTFGIGTGVNRYLIEGLAHAGQGEPYVITSEDGAASAADSFRKYISSPVLTDIKLSFNGFEIYDLAQESFPDVFADRPVIIFGKYRGNPEGNIELTGQAGNKTLETRIELASVIPENTNSSLRYLWARDKIRMLDDLANSGYDEQAAENLVTALGLEYNLLTRYTSFVAVDTEVRNRQGSSTVIRQPLPLPQGVSNYALGRAVGGVSAGNCSKSSAFESISDKSVQEESLFNIETLSAIEIPPQFIKGEQALEEFIKLHLTYPAESKKNNVSGRVIAEFTVDSDGSVIDIRILHSLDNYTDQEVIRLIMLMNGMWKPAERYGKPVSARVIISKFVFQP